MALTAPGCASLSGAERRSLDDSMGGCGAVKAVVVTHFAAVHIQATALSAAVQHAQPTELEVATLHSRRTATSLMRLKVEEADVPLPAGAPNAAHVSAPTLLSSAAAASSATPVGSALIAPSATTPASAAAASLKEEGLISPSSVVALQLELDAGVVIELGVDSSGGTSNAADLDAGIRLSTSAAELVIV